jgi:hypothetical protein
MTFLLNQYRFGMQETRMPGRRGQPRRKTVQDYEEDGGRKNT